MTTPLLRYLDPSGLPAEYFIKLGCGDVIESQADPRTYVNSEPVAVCPVHGTQAAPVVYQSGG
jgi:hypothetical protein